MAFSRTSDQVGRVLSGRYRLLAPVGAGASAVVYLADDTTLRRRVAVKLLREALATDDRFLRRFQAEAHAAAALNHPHVLTVFDTGQDGGEYYLVTEYLGGGSLQAMIDAGHRLSVSQALMIGLEAGRGLQYASRRGLVHRDIKPANLLFDEGEVNGNPRLRIGDFGLARALAEAAFTEPSGSVLGTARYACPEQVRGELVDGRGDVYSLGLVLIEAVTGEVPFAADTTLGALMARVDRPVPVPEQMGPLVEILGQVGQPDPDERPSASQFVAGLLAAAPHLDPPGRLPIVASSTVTNLDAGTRYPTSVVAAPAPSDRVGGANGAALVGAAAAATAVGPALSGAGGGTGRDATMVLAPGEAPPEIAYPLPASDPGGGWDGDDGAHYYDDEPGTARRRWPLLLALVLVVAALGSAGTYAYFSLRTPTHVVPALHGVPADEAQSQLERSKWKVERRDGREDNSVPGTVIAQSPRDGRLEEGRTVVITVSLGNTEVAVPPEIVASHLPVDQANQALQAAGLVVGPPTQAFDENVAAGSVLALADGTQDPSPKGTAVVLVVSQGPAPRKVPDVPASRSVDDAQAALEGVQLKGVTKDVFDDNVPAGQVVSFGPASGQDAARDSNVAINVSKGPELIAVPDVSGLSATAATTQLEQAGFQVSQVMGSPNARVLFTTPDAGSKEKRGTLIILFTTF